FLQAKHAQSITTPYGMPYSPHYFRKSRAMNQAAGGTLQQEWAPESSTPVDVEAGPSATGTARTGFVSAPGHDFPKVGRNDPCPCGSGKKYKRCHGVVT